MRTVGQRVPHLACENGGFGQPAQVRPRALLHRPDAEDHGVGNPDVR